MIITGDCLEEVAKMSECSIDFIVTDPPYGLTGKSGKGGFMGKEWDSGVPGVEFWKEALRIVKPGGMLAAFGGTRTYHRLACAIEDAGWEIRDCVMWVYGSGFPKSHNFGKKLEGWEGYGTSLKPAYEPIILAMRPCEGTFAENALKWGVAGINVDAGRIASNDFEPKYRIGATKLMEERPWQDVQKITGRPMIQEGHELGRWPANVIFDEETARALDEQSGIEASRFFYCAKASSSERNAGLEGMPLKENMRVNAPRENEEAKTANKVQNFHPTVKPLALMTYILKLLAPPGNPIVLDPFCGSGSTLVAAKQLGLRYIGIEKEPEYVEIATARLANGAQKKVEDGQMEFAM